MTLFSYDMTAINYQVLCKCIEDGQDTFVTYLITSKLYNPEDVELDVTNAVADGNLTLLTIFVQTGIWVPTADKLPWEAVFKTRNIRFLDAFDQWCAGWQRIGYRWPFIIEAFYDADLDLKSNEWNTEVDKMEAIFARLIKEIPIVPANVQVGSVEFLNDPLCVIIENDRDYSYDKDDDCRDRSLFLIKRLTKLGVKVTSAHLFQIREHSDESVLQILNNLGLLIPAP